ncbi:Glutamate synthase [NADPH] large chain [hydrothermal vent metagenome]|uniref:Glutamate synthase [NADPH] large chain n=1 Tax=hydrothermal vent metagenome TaxID=652676 RepID=A0A3B0RV86_9ZZZZ
MLRIVIVLFLTLGSPTLAGTTAEQLVEQLAMQESRALKAMSGERLGFLLRRPEAKITYSRDWLKAQPGATGDADWRCLSEALYFEARGESVQGQFAVAEVILNRVDSDSFPGSICAVVKQGTGRKFACQFTFTCDGRAKVVNEPAAFQQAGKIARLMIDGAPREFTDGAMYFHTQNVRPSWARKFTRTATIGVHLFYRPPTQLSLN